MREPTDISYYYNLANKWVSGSIRPEEKQAFIDWYHEQSDVQLSVPEHIASSEDEHRDLLFRKIEKEIAKEERKHKRMSGVDKLIAACILALLAVGLYVYMTQNSSSSSLDVLTKVAQGKAATLTLSDGSVISLDSIREGETVEQPGIQIVKQEDGLITYTLEEAEIIEGEPQYNTISTPGGGQYQIILPDGTKVWLNAASTLIYPTAFTSDIRKVTLIGEGYFEVAHEAERPFLVSTDRQEIIVLGTHFNITAYGNEEITRTTLLEGSVKVIPKSKESSSAVLTPGQQFRLTKDHKSSISAVNMDAVVAWKNGVFSFNDTHIEHVIRELARWYDVDISYEGTPENVHLWGEIGRDVDLGEALDILKYFDYTFKVQTQGGHKKIVIYNQKK